MTSPLRAAASLFSLLCVFYISTNSFSPKPLALPLASLSSSSTSTSKTKSLVTKRFKNTMSSSSSSSSSNTFKVNNKSKTPNSLRLVIMSDTHGRHPSPSTLPPHDVVIHCGDHELSCESLNEYVSAFPKSTTFISVSGNMDSAKISNCNAHDNFYYLQDESINISGINIYGSPWTPKFVGNFQITDKNHGEKIWSNLPTNKVIDILITHGPPKDILDKTSRGQSVGDVQLKNEVFKLKNVRLHCFGHVHASYGTLTKNNTLFINSAIYNNHNPIIVDLPFDKSLPPVLIPFS